MNYTNTNMPCGDPPTNYPAMPAPYFNYPQPGSIGFGMDPNPAFTAAIDRLAAALEKLLEAKAA